MYRLLLGLGSLVLVAVCGQAAIVHADPIRSLDIRVEMTDVSEQDNLQRGRFRLTNNTSDFSVRGFAVTLGTATKAGISPERDGWQAFVQNENPIPELEGSGGAINHFEYVFYISRVAAPADPNYIAPQESDDSFTFELTLNPRARAALEADEYYGEPVGILTVDADGRQVTCLTSVGDQECLLVGPRQVAPDCTTAVASVSTLWPPNHTFVPINIVGVTTSDESPASITIDSISQDEPVQASGTGSGNTCPDGKGVETDTAQVRAERAGKGNGRVYHIAFTATADDGETCTEVVQVCVPHDQGKGKICIDDEPLYDSTECPSRRQ
jgi:hypothetical protein